MKLTFLGTRGYIDARTRRHRRHSSLLVEYRGRRLLIDCGEDWLGKLDEIAPQRIFVTHAHPDHARGLRAGAGCPVHATTETWEGMADYPIDRRETVRPRERDNVLGMTVEAFPVVHSLRAPAVGYRIAAGAAEIFYVPDVIDIQDRGAALGGIDIFVGDGATMTRSMVRRRDHKLFGHTTIRAQLGWCVENSVPCAVFTHCGSEIVNGDERRLGARLRQMAREHGIEARIAHDGMEMTLR